MAHGVRRAAPSFRTVRVLGAEMYVRELLVLGQYGRQFKPVFEAAQKELRDKFGMEMTELPLREKVTISQRRGTSFSVTIYVKNGLDS